MALHPDKNGAPGADEAFKCVYSLCLRCSIANPGRSGLESFPGVVRFVPLLDLSGISPHNASADPQKRAVYDRSGSDPESRFSGMPSSSGGSTVHPFTGASFEGELSPEDLFNMFFGAGGGGPFGNGFGGGGPGKSAADAQLNVISFTQSSIHRYLWSWWIPHDENGRPGTRKECAGQ